MKKESLINLLIGIAVSTVTAILLFSVVLLLYATIVNVSSNNQIYFFGYKPVIVVTGSMVPAIEVNSLSIAKQCNIDEVNIGDVVVYRASNGMLITHRVVEITDVKGQKALITKGDANNARDIYPVTDNWLQSKIVYTNNNVAPIISEIMPEQGRFNAYAAFRGALILLLSIAAVTLLSKIGINTVHQIIWIGKNNHTFAATIKKQKAMEEQFTNLYKNIKISAFDKENKISLFNRILISISRAEFVSELKSIDKSMQKLNEKGARYRKLYQKALPSGTELYEFSSDDLDLKSMTNEQLIEAIRNKTVSNN